MPGIQAPSFRYAADYERYLKEMGSDIRDIIQLLDKQMKQLTASTLAKQPAVLQTANVFTINLQEDSVDTRKRMRRLKQKIDPELVKVVVPNQDALTKQYAACEELYDKYRELNSIEATMNVQFKGETSKAARDAIKDLKNKVEQALRKTLGFIHGLAQHHVPKSFQKYVDAIAAEVNEHLPLVGGSQLMLYVSTYNGSLVFTSYQMLTDVTNEDGTTTPALYVVVQWVVGIEGAKNRPAVEPATYVYLVHEFEPPNKLLGTGQGEEVTTVMQAAKAIGHLLNLEHFSTELGVVPLALQFLRDPSTIDERLFQPRDLIESLKVDKHQMSFVIKKEVPKDLYPELAAQLSADMRNLLQGFSRTKDSGERVQTRGKRNARLRMQIDQGKRQIIFTVVSLAGPVDVDIHDAEFLKERFGLNDSALRRIVHVINTQHGD